MGVTYKRVADTRYSATEVFYKEALNRGAKIKADPYIGFWLNYIKLKSHYHPENIDIIVFCVTVIILI